MSQELVTHWVSSCNAVSKMKWKSKHVTSCSVISPHIKPVSEITLRVTTARFLHLTVSHQTPIGRQANKRLNSLIDRCFFFVFDIWASSQVKSTWRPLNPCLGTLYGNKGSHLRPLQIAIHWWYQSMKTDSTVLFRSVQHWAAPSLVRTERPSRKEELVLGIYWLFTGEKKEREREIDKVYQYCRKVFKLS